MNWINYLLQTNLYLLCFYALYKLAFSRETYFNLNRAYLVGFTLISFFIPFWQSGIVQSWFITKQISETIYTSGFSEVILYTSPVAKAQPFFDIYDWLIMFYSLGVIYMSGLFCINLFKAQKFVNTQTENGLASSFFGKINIDKTLPHQEVIMSHELAHGKEVHSFDLMMISIVKIVCWFNPIVYLINIEFIKIHEFIADNTAACFLGSRKAYAEILVSNQFNTNANSLVHNFYDKANIKARLLMLSRRKSPRTATFKYGLIAPAFIATLILASSFVSNPDEPIFNSKDLQNWDFLSNPFSRELNIIRGVVRNDLGQVLPGATISVIGNANKLVHTDINGRFAIENIESNAMLEASFPGHLSHKKTVSQRGMLFKLRDNAGTLDDVGRIVYNVNEIEFLGKFVKKGQDINGEKAPEFPGGISEMYNFISRNIKYPIPARYKNIEGIVELKVTIDRNGNAINPVIIKSIGGGCEEEILRVIATMPKWTPAMLNNEKVTSDFIIPVKFTLNNGKTSTEQTALKEVFTQVEEEPKFPGGVTKLYEFIGKNLIYPISAVENGVEGRIYVKFIIDKNGEIRDPKVLKGIGYGCEEEAVNVLSKMPKWIPGKQDGELVNVFFTMPIVFKLGDAKMNSKSNQKRKNIKTTNTQLENVNILKKKEAELKYGEQAKNGALVLEINDRPNNSNRNDSSKLY